MGVPRLVSNSRHGPARGDAPPPRPATLPPDAVTTPSRQVATPSAQHRWRMLRQQATVSASSPSRTITRPAWRRIRPATCTSLQRTAAIVCDTHAAGQAGRLKPMKRLYASTPIRKKTALAPESPHGNRSSPSPCFSSLLKFSAWLRWLCQTSTSCAVFSSTGPLLAATDTYTVSWVPQTDRDVAAPPA